MEGLAKDLRVCWGLQYKPGRIA